MSFKFTHELPTLEQGRFFIVDWQGTPKCEDHAYWLQSIGHLKLNIETFINHGRYYELDADREKCLRDAKRDVVFDIRVSDGEYPISCYEHLKF